MTAAHVATAAKERGELAIGGPSSEQGHPVMGAARVDRVETWPDHDVAVLFCKAGKVTELTVWMAQPVQLLTDLGSFGYPHAVTNSGDRLNVVFRGYKGYVIATRRWERLRGEPSVYELSCPFPQGMSGAPVLLQQQNVLAVAGMVLGIDTVEYGGVAQNVGIVMTANEIMGLNSQVLGGPLAVQLGFAAAMLSPQQPDL
jgi:Trypsin-like peptidase domain